MPTALKYDPTKSTSFLEDVMSRSGQKLTACYQCRRCAAGCAVGDGTAPITPDRLVRLIMLGEKEAALSNDLVWKCVSCYTCGTRCPNNIQTGRITETLKKMSKETKQAPHIPKVGYFHDSFVKAGLRWGRVNEMEFMGMYELKHLRDKFVEKDFDGIKQEIMEQMRFGFSMMKKKRMHFDFLTTSGRNEIKRLYKKAKKDQFK
ncbi:heterodisulfide reductase iron-sulfur subunit C [Candidatus Magnetomorum sp. HK-1]|nr:heterodisulfide reductase iron-sulfur subunit C [Candidatus Magnetomorum sp. HK-1]